ncbi:MAG: hypothetical protein HKN08_13055 [Gammaproteobacteria bacterium]|nr:hypothetical protein [Gammaproteobacteria bacterium]
MANEFISINEAKEILKRYSSLDLPFYQKNLKGFWRTVSSQELLQIVNDDK